MAKDSVYSLESLHFTSMTSQAASTSSAKYQGGLPGINIGSQLRKQVFFDEEIPYKTAIRTEGPRFAIQLPTHHDGFVRVHPYSYSQKRTRPSSTVGVGPPTKVRFGSGIPSSPDSSTQYMAETVDKKKARVIFGETDFLRDKLGFCMPSVAQTLATEMPKSEARGNPFGFSYLSRERILVIQRLILERKAALRQERLSQRDKGARRAPMAPYASPLTKGRKKKGVSENKQYVTVLGASVRRNKYMDERAKFALSQELMRQQSKRIMLDKASIGDLDLLMNTKEAMEKERKEKKMKRLRLQRSQQSQQSQLSSQSIESDQDLSE